MSAYLFAQLENLEAIQLRRKEIWQRYWDEFVPVLTRYGISMPSIPDYATNNAHMFYLVCQDLEQRTALISALKTEGIQAVFHYLSLHSSPYFKEKHDGRSLPNSDRFSNCLLRLPMFYELSNDDVDRITKTVIESTHCA